jgi:16S rRNA processing protein RimM
MKHPQHFLFGHISKAHGIKGELVVVLATENPSLYKDQKALFIEVQGKLIPYFIEKMDLLKGKAIIKFEEITNPNAAAAMQGSEVYLPITALPAKDEGDFYYHDVIGFTVVDQEKGELGIVKDIYELPGHDILAMDYMEQEVLIPLHESIINSADIKKKLVFVNLPEGLLDIYLASDEETPDDQDEE